MQKILRRVATAERVAAKRKKIKDLQYNKRTRKEQTLQHREQVYNIKTELKAAKQAVRDAWELGPLAPRTDVGDWAGARGAIHETRYGSDDDLPEVMRNKRCEWAGGASHLNLVIGDRVVLLYGPDKGRIGKVVEVVENRSEVVVEGLNKSNIRVHPAIRNPEDPGVLNIELPIPISAVRLVHPIRDAATGATRDVIINQLVTRDVVNDRTSGETEWTRVVPGLNVAIPWPKKDKPAARDHKCDTRRVDVERKTFVPSLLRPPMPETVIDELRNKYSRFRTRHEPEFIARFDAEEQAKKERQKLLENMRTPLQEFHSAERARKKKKGKPRLTVEMLEKIGQVIAKNRERTVNAAAASKPLPAAKKSAPPSPSTKSAQETSSPPPPSPPTSS
ncbi:hypothetical protein F4779DRAFT_174448 [Xylariaceae sp. FL0662B]|nr:hypothetical protein F4779DRAFT_174448 [Xylariaceae sp. FL0662B]